tara:strand:- start:1708 stop:2004 length:297 start_codon:yes stop_codon:yes gene_type:complete
MKWTTKDGVKMNVEDMESEHAKRVIDMLVRRHSSQLVLECILQGKKALLEQRKSSVDLLTIDLIKLSGDMAQQFNDNYPGDESDDSWDYDPRWDPNYL